MAMISSLWSTLIGHNKAAASKRSAPPAKSAAVSGKNSHLSLGGHNHIHLEKRKLVATRSQLESQSNPKLNLEQLRARIESDSREYAELRERQQTSISRWFGERSTGIDEAALTKRLAAPTPRLSQDELELSLNYSDIYLPDYYESPELLPSGFAIDCPEDLGNNLEVNLEIEIIDISDTADFSDMADDFAEVSLLPPLVALSDNIPELDDLLARLQIAEWLEQQESESLNESSEDEQLALHERHADLHIVTPFEVCQPAPVNSPVPMIKRHGKGKKARRARSKEAAKMKNGTRN